MNQLEYQRELIAFDEKIALSELEAKKAEERVKELQYQKARFNLDYINAVIKAQAAAQTGPAPVQG
jgi:hypothetical protein